MNDLERLPFKSTDFTSLDESGIWKHRDGTVVVRSQLHSLPTLEKGKRELQRLESQYGILSPNYQIVAISSESKQSMGVLITNFVEGISLDPVFSPDWNLDQFQVQKSAQELSDLLLPLIHNYHEIISATEEYWSKVLLYQLESISTNTDYIYDLAPDQAIFVENQLILVDLGPEFISNWSGLAKNNSTNYFTFAFNEYFPSLLSQLKSMFPQTNAEMFPKSTALTQRLIKLLKLSVINPFSQI